MHAAVADLAYGAPTRGRPGALNRATPARRSWAASTGSTPPVGCGSGGRGVGEQVGRERVATPRGVMARWECSPARPLLAVPGRLGRIRTSDGLWEWHRGRKRAR
jgi:hypothetical protein